MFLFIDNYDSFSFNIVQYLRQTGREPLVLTNDNPRLLDLATDPKLEAVVISPGPSSPDKAGYCLEFLERLPHRVPVLGICLGHQCLGLHAGCPVQRGPRVMHGKTSRLEHDGTGLFRGIASPMTVGRYHSLVVKCPDDHPLLEVTSRDEDGEVMSMRFKDRPWAGVQFHPESILTPEGLRLIANFPKAILRGMTMASILDTLADGRDLTQEQAEQSFAALMDGKMTPAQAGAFLLTLRAKGESATEIAAAVSCALERSKPVRGIAGDYVDIVGTGGDGKKSFNCSTATAIVMAALGFRVVKHGNRAVSSSSGAADVLDWRSPHFVYRPEGCPGMKLMLTSPSLSADIASRFSDRSWAAYPLMAETYAHWLRSVKGNGEVINLSMNYESFGEHQGAETGIFEFMHALPDQILSDPEFDFLTVSEAADRYGAYAALDVPYPMSRAGDLAPWLGNDMQKDAFRALCECQGLVDYLNDEELTGIWRKLQTSDHLYYMGTIRTSDGNAYPALSPYGTPLEAYTNFMNILADLRIRLVAKSNQ